MKVRALALPLAWGYSALLLLALLVPVGGPPPPELGLDKAVHLVIYGILALAWQAAWGQARWRRILLVCLSLAIGTEALQAALPWRSFELWDILANLVGVAMALGLAWWPRGRHSAAGQPVTGESAMRVST